MNEERRQPRWTGTLFSMVVLALATAACADVESAPGWDEADSEEATMNVDETAQEAGAPEAVEVGSEVDGATDSDDVSDVSEANAGETCVSYCHPCGFFYGGCCRVEIVCTP